ncbi:hypothetical protein H257_08486 [Aphanomyces astaci]|uniref:Uncharacterized protein n=1 Tax=Aphanomyces astaci TaxID=112090 RepID=W4GF41_APHAT|nr:hypothetical protein H257_08486 [Aphanomyces astaci]ETV77558.1 hypothetical protein H257_08486 [Aphanomyces astaci]|eukprot:XP_009832668.1 hypothetical protein H257_08486 [Aphanomyces astaci]
MQSSLIHPSSLPPSTPSGFVSRLQVSNHRHHPLTRRILQLATTPVTADADGDDCFRSIAADDIEMTPPCTPPRNAKRPREDEPPRHRIPPSTRLSPRRAELVASCGLPFWDEFDGPSAADVTMSLRAQDDAWPAIAAALRRRPQR